MCMLNVKYKLPGFISELPVSPKDLAVSRTELELANSKNTDLGCIMPSVSVPCNMENPYCRNCNRICRRETGEDYYFCMDKCVPGGIFIP